MADLPYPDSYRDTGDGTDGESTTGPPRWVKVIGIIALVLVLLAGILLLTGGGSHGPGRHTASGEAGGQTPPSSVPGSGGAGGQGGGSRGRGRHTP